MSKKIHVLTRNPYDFQRETKFDIHKISRNHDSNLHHFTQEREYVRATNASKIQRFLAKPFIRSLDGSLDDVKVMSVDPKRLSLAAFGTADGRIEYWNISANIKLFDIKPQNGSISGVSHFSEGNFLTCGSDKIVRHWDFKDEIDYQPWTKAMSPISTFTLDEDPRCLNAQLFGNNYAIGTTDRILIYKTDVLARQAVATFGDRARQNVHCVKFHPTEINVLCGLTGDNKISLYDIRSTGKSAQIKMTHRSTAMSFNPQFPTFFTTASDDYNLYTFDMRYFDKPIKIHKGHVMSVTDVCYSNRGNEFVAGSVDKTIRIFNKDDSIAREVYTNKRMGRVLNVRYTFDDHYILSASADHNVRLWKTHASAKLGAKTPRQERSLLEANKLCQKFSANPEVKKILNRRRVPNIVKKLANEHQVIERKIKRKDRNIKMHAPPGKVTLKNKFEKSVVSTE